MDTFQTAGVRPPRISSAARVTSASPGRGPGRGTRSPLRVRYFIAQSSSPEVTSRAASRGSQIALYSGPVKSKPNASASSNTSSRVRPDEVARYDRASLRRSAPDSTAQTAAGPASPQRPAPGAAPSSRPAVQRSFGLPMTSSGSVVRRSTGIVGPRAVQVGGRNSEAFLGEPMPPGAPDGLWRLRGLLLCWPPYSARRLLMAVGERSIRPAPDA